MSGVGRQDGSSPWTRLGANLPDGADSGGTLLVGPAGAAALGLDEAVRWDPVAGDARPAGQFGLAVCAEALQADAHPANLMLAIWEAMPVGGMLLLHSRVLTDPGQSAYARFVAADAGTGDTEWLPGRLALRWTVETNGFDIVRWIDAGSSEPRGEDDAYLIATRTERTPSLVLATPIPVDGPSQEGGAS
jgi:hypothetical protein